MSDAKVSKPTDILQDHETQTLLNQADYADLMEKLNSAEQKNAEYWERILRMQADADNLARRTEREINNAHKFALERFLTDLLPVIDNLERGIEAAREISNAQVDAIKSGVELTLQMLQEVLAKTGVQIVHPVNQQFNPDLHEAISTQNSVDSQPGIVLTVLQKGYVLNGRLIRPAMVIVAK